MSLINAIAKPLRNLFGLLLAALLCVSCSTIPSLSNQPWNLVPLPTESDLADIAFTGNANHGWLVGSNSTLLETQDGGETWQSKTLDLGDRNYRFNAVSFSGQEGWIAGQPLLLLHTNDGGASWSRIPLSEKLPGDPNMVVALGPQSAEMATNIGAIYQTSDGGKTWQAMVQQAVGVVRNISRSASGQYVTVSSNGSFYSTWAPGLDAWQPHNRNSSRRVQNMGFSQDNRLWMLARGGQLQFSQVDDLESWEDATYPEPRANWGLLDLAYRTSEELWIVGGSGDLLCSLDGGETWQKDRDMEDVPANFYKVLFLDDGRGFVLGQRGTLLKYQDASRQAA